MDIMDDFSKEDQLLGEDQVVELRAIMRSLQRNMIDLNTYYKRLAEFWDRQGFPEWAEEIMERVKD
jgi:dissimilatory sulfite reductase (desulfoviridin) alpha/beta subunit